MTKALACWEILVPCRWNHASWPTLVKLSYPPSPTGNCLFHLFSCLHRNKEVKVSCEAWGWGLGWSKKNLQSVSNAATFGSEEVCADPLLGLTHLKGLGGGLPSVCPTVANCLTGVNEHQKVDLSLLLWMSEGPWLLTPRSPWKNLLHGKQKKKTCLEGISFHSNVNCGCSSLRGLPEQRRCDQAMFWMLSAVAIGKHLSPPLTTRRLHMGWVNN